jgi:hypothetical protein
MAKSAAATKGAARKPAGRAEAPRRRKAVEDGADISSLVSEVMDLEGQVRAQTGSQNSWVTLATGNSGVVSPKDPRYMKGVKLLDFVIPDKKIRLGPSFQATILGMFKLYQETPKKQSENDLPPVVGFWMPDDAEKIPLGENNFTRTFVARDGSIHELNPVHWVHIYIHGHEDVTDAIVPFRSKGNEFYRDLMKLVKRDSRICTELRFKVGSQAVANEKYRKTDYYPSFEVAGKNFLLEDDGSITRVKGGFSEEELAEVLTRSRDSQKNYAECRLVGKKNVAAITGAKPAAALPPGSDGYEDAPDDEDEEELDL